MRHPRFFAAATTIAFAVIAANVIWFWFSSREQIDPSPASRCSRLLSYMSRHSSTVGIEDELESLLTEYPGYVTEVTVFIRDARPHVSRCGHDRLCKVYDSVSKSDKIGAQRLVAMWAGLAVNHPAVMDRIESALGDLDPTVQLAARVARYRISGKGEADVISQLRAGLNAADDYEQAIAIQLIGIDPKLFHVFHTEVEDRTSSPWFSVRRSAVQVKDRYTKGH